MYKKNKNAFGLLEIIVATSILTIAVFGVYKMIGENTKLINNNDNYMQMSSLFPSFENCIYYLLKNSIVSTNTGYNENFGFGNNGTGCLTGSSQKVDLDNIKYTLSGTIISNNSNSIDWKLKISNESVGEIIKDYKYSK